MQENVLPKQFLNNLFKHKGLEKLQICCPLEPSSLERIGDCHHLKCLEVPYFYSYKASLEDFTSIAALGQLETISIKLSPRITPAEFFVFNSKMSSVKYLTLTWASNLWLTDMWDGYLKLFPTSKLSTFRGTRTEWPLFEILLCQYLQAATIFKR